MSALPERRSRVRRIALAAAALCLVPAAISYAEALARPSNSSLGIRTVEWMRDNGARVMVTDIENLYYSLNGPSKGGPALRALPKQAGVASPLIAARRRVHYYRPPPIRPIVQSALPGEGVWRATFAGRGARPPVLVASFRPDPDYPQQVAGVAWIDHTRAPGFAADRRPWATQPQLVR